MIFILLILLLCLTGFNFIICQRDVMAPPVIVDLTFVFGVLCAIANNKIWGVNLSFETLAIILIGISSFAIGYTLIKQRKALEAASLPQNIEIENIKNIIIIIYGLITIFLYFSEVRRMASAYGYSGGFSMMMSAYSAVTKYKTTLGADIEGMSSYVNIMYKGLTAIAYVYAYLFLRLLCVAKNWKRQLKKKVIYCIPIVEFIICTICSASRLAILKLFVAMILLYFSFRRKDSGWKRINLKAYRKIIIGILLVAFLFSYTRGLVGRNNSLDPFKYITTYAGGPIELLDLYVKHPNTTNTLVGQETFSAIYSIIYRISGNTAFNYSVHKEFRNSTTGVTVGNVYTAFRAYYNDFGIIGVVVIPLLIGIVYAILYRNIKRNTNKSAINMNFLIYAYFSAGFVFMFIDDLFCSTIVGANTIIMLLMFYLIRWFLLKVHIKIKYR